MYRFVCVYVFADTNCEKSAHYYIYYIIATELTFEKYHQLPNPTLTPNRTLKSAIAGYRPFFDACTIL